MGRIPKAEKMKSVNNESNINSNTILAQYSATNELNKEICGHLVLNKNNYRIDNDNIYFPAEFKHWLNSQIFLGMHY